MDGVTGVGLMIGVTFGPAKLAAAVERECFRRGLLVLQVGDRTVRIALPLVLREDQAVAGADLLTAVVTEVCGRP